MYGQDDRWQSLIDSLLKDVLEDGRTNDLPGAGRPLDLRENPYTPHEMRMAYKILQDNEIAPEWITAGKALEAALDTLRNQLQQAMQAYDRAVAAVPTGQMESTVQRARSVLSARLDSLKPRIEDYNRDVLSYNLKVPPGISHRSLFDLERERARLMNSQ